MNRPALIFILSWLALATATARKHPVPDIVQRVFDYASAIDTTAQVGRTSYAYTRFRLNVERKNPTLLLVPSVYAIAHRKQREYVGETYHRVTMRRFHDSRVETLLRTTTVPHRHSTMTNVAKYLRPEIYDETVIEDYLLSPFHRNNRNFYRYRTDTLKEGTVHLTFTPRRKSTQLVSGDAIVNPATGQVLKCSFAGEYDMVDFRITLYMGRKGIMSLIPERCELQTLFRFIRSKITGRYVAYYNLPQVLTDSIAHEDDYAKMCFVRPDTIDRRTQQIYGDMVARRRKRDSLRAAQSEGRHGKSWTQTVLWDAIGDNVLNRIKTNFGLNNQGYVRVNPILNPLYMGYDHRRGFTYKFDVRFSYQFTPNSEVSARLKAGYAFKQHQFYYRVPIFYYFNKRRNGYLKLEVGNGNHIRHQSVRESVEQLHPDTTGMHLPDFDLLNEFRHNDLRLVFNYELSDRWGFQIGSLYQRREAINREAFHQLGITATYQSFSPILQLQYRPWGWRGPIFTADYDRSIKGIFNSNTAYERIELNAEYIHRFNQLRALKMRAGSGFYTWKDRKAYFLNYENFQENNIPGGWNDDWSGEFELLRSETYNNSEYYVRANVTYESPLLVLSRLPLVGHFMEMERIYLSALDVKANHPYVELGYGFTTRLFSCGLFVSNGRGNRVFGCKVGFELFRHW